MPFLYGLTSINATNTIIKNEAIRPIILILPEKTEPIWYMQRDTA